MELLAEIFHSEGINLAGKAVTRNAVRGIVVDHDKLLMIYSAKNGDYKFPGGGVENGEDQKTALIRELKEESGVEIVKIEREFGKVIEYDIPIEKDYEVFKMTSRYYFCSIRSVFGKQQLDPYEEDLGFTARWIRIEEALNRNKALLRERYSDMPRWVKREIFVLEKLTACC